MARKPKAAATASQPEAIDVEFKDVLNLNVPEFYGHSSQMIVSSTDFTLVMARQVPVMVGGQHAGILMPAVAVHMSPGTAKDLALVLTRNLADFEAEWGKIETSYTRRVAKDDTAKKMKKI